MLEWVHVPRFLFCGFNCPSRFDGFPTSLLDIPCSILDIQKQSRGGAEGAEAEISTECWGFLLACPEVKLASR